MVGSARGRLSSAWSPLGVASVRWLAVTSLARCADTSRRASVECADTSRRASADRRQTMEALTALMTLMTPARNIFTVIDELTGEVFGPTHRHPGLTADLAATASVMRRARTLRNVSSTARRRLSRRFKALLTSPLVSWPPGIGI